MLTARNNGGQKGAGKYIDLKEREGKPTHSHPHTPIHTHSLTHTHTLSLSLSLEGAVTLCRAWYAKGYLPIYLSGRQGSFYNFTRDWCVKKELPPGPIVLTDTHKVTQPQKKKKMLLVLITHTHTHSHTHTHTHTHMRMQSRRCPCGRVWGCSKWNT